MSWATNEGTRRSMQSNRSRDTAPELAVRKLLHASGLRYRVASRPVPSMRRTADILFTRAKLAVFIDGCFWHGCPAHYVEPKSHVEYWRPKIAGNIARDLDTTRQLVDEGWIVVRFWAHESPNEVANSITRTLQRIEAFRQAAPSL